MKLRRSKCSEPHRYHTGRQVIVCFSDIRVSNPIRSSHCRAAMIVGSPEWIAAGSEYCRGEFRGKGFELFPVLRFEFHGPWC